MESDLKGKVSSGAHSVTPAVTSGASRVVCCVRATSSQWCLGPQAPTCKSSKPKTLSSACIANAASSRSTRAPKGPSNQSLNCVSAVDSNLNLLHKNTSEVLMLQVKYAAKCQSTKRILTCTRCAHSPTTTSGSSN